MFSTTLEYALRAVTCLAARPDEGLTTPVIAECTQVPEQYLSKVLQQLVRGDVLISQRGRTGGFRLARPAAEISMLSVVNAVEPIPRLDTCPLGLQAHGVKLCPLHRRLNEAYRMVEQAFAVTSLGELVEDNAKRKSLCEKELEIINVG